MKLLVVSGSRADYGLLEWPIKVLQADPYFDVHVEKMWGAETPSVAMQRIERLQTQYGRPDCILLLGDRFEITATAFMAHLHRIPIAHIAGGDITRGSYDDAMRDCISRMATWHFTTSKEATERLQSLGYKRVHMVGSPGIDYIMHGDWRGMRPYPDPYVVVSYQPETIDGTNEIGAVLASLPDAKRHIIFAPNTDAGSIEIREHIQRWATTRPSAIVVNYMPHDQFLNLLLHCDEFIGNSSAILYEAPTLGVRTRMVGKRQEGRVAPWGDGRASERIRDVLKEWK